MLKIENKKTIISRDSRGSRRLRSFALLKYVLSAYPGRKPVLVNARDISASGVSFISDAGVPSNSMLEMDIYLPPIKNFITVIANVVRSSRIGYSDRYLVGARFSAIDPAERLQMSSYLEKMAGDLTMRPYFDRQAKRFRRRIF